MYGLLLENLATFIKSQWGEGKWESVRRHAGIDMVAFSIHHVYSETLMQRLTRSCFQVLGVDERQFFEAMGLYFVQYVSQYGYDQILSVLGRHMRDFLNGLDNLHEYLKFSYPKMRAPSFYCDEETESGLKLHYRSKRRGFVYYVMGQIKQVANQFYKQDCEILLISEELVGETMHVVFQLNFDNSAFTEAESIRSRIAKDLKLPVQAATLFELFPFCIVFNKDMEITHTGHTLMTILKDLVGQIMTEAFDMIRPLIPFCFSAVMQRRNNIFELVTVAPIHDVNHFFEAHNDSPHEETEGTRLHIRGQMLYMQEWDMMLYLANPVMPDLGSLVDAGLFVNDLSLHDCSRDFVLAGTQQSVELKLALDQEQQKSRKLVDSMKKLDEEMRRTDELLYQMIPKQVADRIRQGENPVDTCQTFEMVSILFSDVVNFTDICSKITPMQVVNMLNHMYSLFDQLTERNGVYKVETIGDSYMVVSGAPVEDSRHAEKVCDMALDMVDASEAIEDPSEEATSLKVRVGCHSGMVVGGVVGVKMPRYCLFGDTVNMASRMESTSDASRIQISEACKRFLPTLYETEFRGTIPLKGKGNVSTFWLIGREARISLSKYHSKAISWSVPAPAPTVAEVTHRAIAATIVKNVEAGADATTGLTKFDTPTTASIATSTGVGVVPRPDFKCNTKPYKRPAWRSAASRSSAFRSGRLSSCSSTSTLLNSLMQVEPAVSTSRNSVPTEFELQQTDLADGLSLAGSVTCNFSTENASTNSLLYRRNLEAIPKEIPSSTLGSVVMSCDSSQKLYGKRDISLGSESQTEDTKSSLPEDSENSNKHSCKMGVLFFHNCLAGRSPVDNPNPSSTSILLVKRGTNDRQKVASDICMEADTVIVDTTESGVIEMSNDCMDFRDIYLTHPLDSYRSVTGRNNRVVSRACILL